MTSMTAWGHILLAEDNAVSQRVTKAMLEHLGFHVDVATFGMEAVSAAAVTPYRAILMDCQLPDLDGPQVVREIRRWQGASSRAPIIAVTASARPADQARCLAAGMDDFVSKPLNIDLLAEVLARWAPDNAELAGTAHPIADDATEAPVAPRTALDAVVVARLERLGDAGGEDLMGQLTILFGADAGDRVRELRSALGAHDANALFRAAHTLSGASANVGALTLARAAGELAALGEAGDLSDCGTRIDEIAAELERVNQELSARIPAP